MDALDRDDDRIMPRALELINVRWTNVCVYISMSSVMYPAREKDTVHVLGNIYLRHPSHLCVTVMCMVDMTHLLCYVNCITVVARDLLAGLSLIHI